MDSGMTLDALLAEPPLLHSDKGQPVSWRISDDVLRLLDAEVQPGWRTIETGEGVTTLLFGIRGAEHTCVTPNSDAVARIRAFAADHGISLDKVRFEVGFSQDVLPGLEQSAIDVAVVDGGHGFPVPFIDWWYMARRLRKGGLLIVDDLQLWTGAVLTAFLASEPEWTVYRDFSPRSVVYRKEVDGLPYKEWTAQAFMHRGMAFLEPPSRLRRVSALLREGNFGELGRRLRRRLANR